MWGDSVKTETEEMILEEMKKFRDGGTGSYDDFFDELVDKYFSAEISWYGDFFKNHIKFINFIDNHSELLDMNRLEGKDTNTKINGLKNSLWLRFKGFSIFSPICYGNVKTTQDAYTNLVSYITSKKDGILDVGAGSVPLSSILMVGRTGANISAMDNITLPRDVMARFEVEPHYTLFNRATDLSNADIVVAHRACGAFPSVVENCAKSNKAYLMRLCNCSAPDNDITKWKDILTPLDNKILFDSSGKYVTNLDISRDTLDKKIDEFGCLKEF